MYKYIILIAVLLLIVWWPVPFGTYSVTTAIVLTLVFTLAGIAADLYLRKQRKKRDENR